MGNAVTSKYTVDEKHVVSVWVILTDFQPPKHPHHVRYCFKRYNTEVAGLGLGGVRVRVRARMKVEVRVRAG